MTKPSLDKQKPFIWGLDVVYQHAAQIEAELMAKKLSLDEYLQTTIKDNCNSAVELSLFPGEIFLLFCTYINNPDTTLYLISTMYLINMQCY